MYFIHLFLAPLWLNQKKVINNVGKSGRKWLKVENFCIILLFEIRE